MPFVDAPPVDRKWFSTTSSFSLFFFLVAPKRDPASSYRPCFGTERACSFTRIWWRSLDDKIERNSITTVVITIISWPNLLLPNLTKAVYTGTNQAVYTGTNIKMNTSRWMCWVRNPHTSTITHDNRRGWSRPNSSSSEKLESLHKRHRAFQETSSLWSECLWKCQFLPHTGCNTVPIDNFTDPGLLKAYRIYLTTELHPKRELAS